MSFGLTRFGQAEWHSPFKICFRVLFKLFCGSFKLLFGFTQHFIFLMHSCFELLLFMSKLFIINYYFLLHLLMNLHHSCHFFLILLLRVFECSLQLYYLLLLFFSHLFKLLHSLLKTLL